MRQFFPFHYEMIFILVLATFSKYADVRANFVRRQEDKKQKKGSSIPDSQKAYEDALHQDGFSSSATEEGKISDSDEKTSTATGE